LELRNKDEVKTEILQSWVGSAWVYPTRGPDERPYLRLTPGGRLKMRRRIGELEAATGMSGPEALKGDRENTLPVERDKLELAMMFQAYSSERRLIEAQGILLGPTDVAVEEAAEEGM
jgi:hypothetical protein